MARTKPKTQQECRDALQDLYTNALRQKQTKEQFIKQVQHSAPLRRLVLGCHGISAAALEQYNICFKAVKGKKISFEIQLKNNTTQVGTAFYRLSPKVEAKAPGKAQLKKATPTSFKTSDLNKHYSTAEDSQVMGSILVRSIKKRKHKRASASPQASTQTPLLSQQDTPAPQAKSWRWYQIGKWPIWSALKNALKKLFRCGSSNTKAKGRQAANDSGCATNDRPDLGSNQAILSQHRNSIKNARRKDKKARKKAKSSKSKIAAARRNAKGGS